MSSSQPALLDQQSSDQIRSRPCPKCFVCGAEGELLYEGLKDRLFGAPGTWNLKRCPNPACRSLWLDPMPVEEDIGKAYHSYYTHQDDFQPPNNLPRRVYRQMQEYYLSWKFGYHRKGDSIWSRIAWPLIFLSPIRRANFDFSVFYLRAQPKGRLLEVGCGGGAMLHPLKELGWQVEGVDFDPAAVQKARAKGLKVHLGALEEQRFADNTFDAITMSHVIEHVHRPIGLLQECHRLLKPGGRLVVVTPNARSWGHCRYGADWRGLEPPRHLHTFTVTSLAATCARAGFGGAACRSIVRGGGILLASRSLQRTGSAYAVHHPSVSLRLWAEMMGHVEWVRTLMDHEAGEELLLIAGKNGNDA